MAIFALNIMPYISASIIIQLMTTVSPQLEALKKEGEIRPQDHEPVHAVSHRGCSRRSNLTGIAIGLEGTGNVVSAPGFFFLMSTTITLTGAAPCS